MTAAVAVDVLRFHGHVAHIEWLNMVLIWGFAHQLGFFWQRLLGAPRRLAWSLVLAGILLTQTCLMLSRDAPLA